MPFTLDVDSARELLLEQDARRLENNGDNSAPVLGDGEVARYWSEIQPDYAHQLVAYLEEYASAKNNSKRQYVDNPIIEGEEKQGRWRQARVLVSMEGDVARVIQVLRKGWRTTLLSNGAIDFSESRIIRTRELEGNSSELAGISNTASANEEKYLFVRFPNISPSNINGIMAELRGITTISNPSIKGSVFTGEYRKLYAVSDIEQSDGSMTVDLLIAQPQFTINAYRDWGGVFGGEITYLWNVPKELGQQIITDFRASGAGKGATAGYNSEQGTLDIILTSKRTDPKSLQGVVTASNCSSSAQSDYFFDVENPNDAAYTIGGASYPSASGVTYRKDVRSNNDGTYDVVVTTINVVDRAYEDKIVENTNFDLTTRDYNYGLTSEAGLPALSSFVAGQIQSRNYRHNEDCTIDVTTDTQQAKNVVGAARTVQFDSSERLEELSNTNDSAEVTHASSAVLGQIVTTSSRVNRFGLWDNSTRTQYSYNQTAGGGELRHDQTVSVQKNTQSENEAAPVSPASGTVVLYDSEPTRYGKFSTTIRTITAINQEGSSRELRADQTSESDIQTQRAAPFVQARSAGTIVRLQSAPTEFGRYRATKEIITAVNQSAQASEYRGDQTSSTQLSTHNNSQESASSQDGVIVRVSNTPTEFGTFRTTRDTITAINQTATFSEARADQNSSIETQSSAGSIPAGSRSDGQIVRIDAAPTEFPGRFRTRKETISAISQSGSSREERADQISVASISTQASASLSGSRSAGTILREDSQPTEFGRFRTRSEVITPINQTSTGGQTGGTRSSVVTINTQNDQQEPLTGIEGKIVIVENTPTEFGKFRTRKEVITPAPKGGGGAVCSGSQETITTIQLNAESAETSLDCEDGCIVRKDSRPNEFGKYDIITETTCGKNQQSFSNSERQDQRSETELNTQNANEVTASGALGTIQIAQNTPTEFGRFRTVLETVTAIEQTADFSEKRANSETGGTNYFNAASIPSPAGGDGKITRVIRRKNEFGRFDGSSETTTANQTSGGGGSGGGLVTSSFTLFDNSSDSSTEVTGGATNSIVRLDVTPTEFPGRFRRRQETITVSPGQGALSGQRGDATISGNNYVNQTAIPQDPGDTTDAIIRRNFSVNEYGSYNGTIEILTPTERSGGGGDTGHIESSEVDIKDNTSNTSFNNQPITGSIVRFEYSPTEYPNRFRTRKETITAKQVDGVNVVSRADATVQIDTVKNATVAVQPATGVGGQTTRHQSIKNNFGLYDYTSETTTVINTPLVSISDRADRTVTTTTNNASSSNTPDNQGGTGTIVNFDASVTEFHGRWRTREEVITAKPLTNGRSELRGDATVLSSSLGNSSTYPQTAGASGTYETLEYRQNEFGLYDYTHTTRTAIDTVLTDTRSGPTSTTTVTTHSANSSSTASQQTASGINVTFDASPTEFIGRYRTREEVVTAVEATGEAEETRGGATIVTNTGRNAASPTKPTAGDGKQIRWEKRPTEFQGRYDYTSTTITAVNESSQIVNTSSDRVTTIDINSQNSSNASTASTGVNGQIQNFEASPTEFPGRWRTRLETIVATEQTGESEETRGGATITTSIGRNAQAPVKPTSGDGKQTRWEKRPTEFPGCFDYTSTTITAVNETYTSVNNSADRTTTVEIQSQNSSSASPASSGVNGQIQNFEASPTEFPNRFRTKLETITATEQTGELEETRADSTVSTTIGKNAQSPTKPTGGDGKITRWEKRPTEFPGCFDYESTTRTAIDLTSSRVNSNHATTSTITSHTQSSTGTTGTQKTQGRIVRFEATPTEFPSRYSTREEIVDATNQTSNSWVVGPLSTSVEIQNTSSNSQELQPLPPPASGSITSYSSDPTEFGTYRTVKRTVSPIAKKYSFTYNSKWDTVRVQIGRNQPSGTCAAEATSQYSGDSISADLNINEYGLEDYKVVTVSDYSGDAWDQGNREISWDVKDSKDQEWTITKKWCKNKNEANNFLSGTNAAVGGGHVTGVEAASRGRFIATKVVEKN